ncbi:MAG: PPC domain-containing DNA-binding protein [Burkholderiales bacterium]
MHAFALRLNPDEDIKPRLDAEMATRNVRAACVLTCVGSLKRLAIRFADQTKTTVLHGKFEIVSMVGTLSPDGSHLHIAVADETGRILGGHLKEGTSVHTTAEVVIGVLPNAEFGRFFDPTTGFRELRVLVGSPKKA